MNKRADNSNRCRKNLCQAYSSDGGDSAKNDPWDVIATLPLDDVGKFDFSGPIIDFLIPLEEFLETNDEN